VARLLDNILQFVLAFRMEYYKLILPNTESSWQTLGGNTLKWIYEFAYITASLEFPEQLPHVCSGYVYLEKRLNWVKSCAL
jgi:hypothetical protein